MHKIIHFQDAIHRFLIIILLKYNYGIKQFLGNFVYRPRIYNMKWRCSFNFSKSIVLIKSLILSRLSIIRGCRYILNFSSHLLVSRHLVKWLYLLKSNISGSILRFVFGDWNWINLAERKTFPKFLFIII